MKKEWLVKLLKQYKVGEINVENIVENIINIPYVEYKNISIDTHRHIRKGFSEVIFCENKKVEDIKLIYNELIKNHKTLLFTKLSEKKYKSILAIISKNHIYNCDAKCLTIGKPEKKIGLVSVITAGASDVPVAEECSETIEAMGINATKFYDIGVAGLHRLLDKLDTLKKSDVIVAIAGMDGILPTVITGLVSTPVIGVPTDIGYGTNFSGLTPLFTMLNSCAPGISVVNINNGFGAGYSAAAIVKRIHNK